MSELKERILAVVLMMITVPLAGEFKFYPFNDAFRVSLGTPAFFLFLLLGRGIHPNIVGILTGTSVFVFRFLLAVIIRDIPVEEAIYHHFPVFFYYVVYAFMFHFTKLNDQHNKPFMIGLLGVVIEFWASLSEMAIRSSLADQTISFYSIEQIIFIAFIRSFFVLGFFNIFKLREAKLAEEEQRRQNEQMLLFISNLYEESVQLKKTMQNAEEITRICYDFYRRLKSGDYHGHDAQTALQIAGLVHEMKKDNQRIYAGLSKLMSSEKLEDYMSIEQLSNIMFVSNRRYAELLNKHVSFSLQVEEEHPPYHVYMVLSLINNLISNAVEAIEQEGHVSLYVIRRDRMVEFHVCDNGPGIAPKLKEVIFKDGFTTKYDACGNPSTGIGLSYVKQTVDKLGGHIKLIESHKETVFVIEIPIEAMIQKG
ncbi:sensor histidine kinase [Bacillus sp. OV166]|uniref:sensor histidine kinase n=1 Tax=Bacillus sp. OV166 TaxID=1882763 RepID=UPI00277D0EA8|nr:sensor histidine kinase [Bacillus sp. OV166]